MRYSGTVGAAEAKDMSGMVYSDLLGGSVRPVAYERIAERWRSTCPLLENDHGTIRRRYSMLSRDGRGHRYPGGHEDVIVIGDMLRARGYRSQDSPDPMHMVLTMS